MNAKAEIYIRKYGLNFRFLKFQDFSKNFKILLKISEGLYEISGLFRTPRFYSCCYFPMYAVATPAPLNIMRGGGGADRLVNEDRGLASESS